MEEKLIIFDFDGVLADSFDTLYKINSIALEKVGIDFSRDDYRNCFIGESNKRFREFCDDNNYEKFNNIKKVLKKRIYEEISLFSMSEYLIAELKKRNCKLGIISATEREQVEGILEKKFLNKYFDFIFSSSGISKSEKLRQALQLCGHKAEDSYFITDTSCDIDDGKKVGIKTIAVLWGFHDEKLLKSSKPDFLLKNHEDIFSVISNK